MSSKSTNTTELKYYDEPNEFGIVKNSWALFFWKPPCLFNNWTLVKFQDMDGIQYDCVEQYFMAKKALLFKDQSTYLKIMATVDGKLLKALGRAVKNFDQTVWDKECDQIMKNGIYLKFSQNPRYTLKLLETGDLILVEASLYDKRWGIGVESKTAVQFTGPDQFKGENRLGKCLMQVREQLKRERN